MARPPFVKKKRNPPPNSRHNWDMVDVYRHKNVILLEAREKVKSGEMTPDQARAWLENELEKDTGHRMNLANPAQRTPEAKKAEQRIHAQNLKAEREAMQQAERDRFNAEREAAVEARRAEKQAQLDIRAKKNNAPTR
jgi:hypothetical protein